MGVGSDETIVWHWRAKRCVLVWWMHCRVCAKAANVRCRLPVGRRLERRQKTDCHRIDRHPKTGRSRNGHRWDEDLGCDPRRVVHRRIVVRRDGTRVAQLLFGHSLFEHRLDGKDLFGGPLVSARNPKDAPKRDVVTWFTFL
jgi:hypothetical protein